MVYLQFPVDDFDCGMVLAYEIPIMIDNVFQTTLFQMKGFEQYIYISVLVFFAEKWGVEVLVCCLSWP